MDVLTQTIWDFMSAAYRKGLLDESLSLAGKAMPADMDLGDALGTMEEFLVSADFSGLETLSETILPSIIKALSTDEALVGLKEAIVILGPAIQDQATNGGMDAKTMLNTGIIVGKSLMALRPVVPVLLPVLTSLYSDQIKEFVKNQAGTMMAGALNAGCKAIINNPDITAKVMADIFSAIDVQSLGQALATLIKELPAHRPPLARLTMMTFVKGSGIRLLRRIGGKK